jgi:Zn-dependent M28 family amino/carboxypeptidase
MGRDTGSPGFDSASLYIEENIRSLGLRPGGIQNGYRQFITFNNARVVKNSVRFKINGLQLNPGSDFVVAPLTNVKEVEINAPMVFAGLGIDAEELHYNDFDQLDVFGKVVMIIRDAPKSFDLVERAVATSSETTEKTLVAKGALAVVRIFPESFENVSSWPILSKKLAQPRLRYVDEINNQEIPSIALNYRSAVEIFNQAGQNYSEILDSLIDGHTVSFEFGFNAEVKAEFEHGSIKSHNLAGVLEGSDPKLKGEFLVMTAHLDHIGVNNTFAEDSIFNGTLDNASGAAAILVLAEAFKKMAPPKRSILFLWLTGEEKGLLGSEFFARYPTILPSKIVANQNIDGIIGMIVESSDIIAYGYEHSNLSLSVDFAVKRMDMTLSADPLPEQNIFVRSDQYSFVKEGYPALYIVSGRTAADKSLNGLGKFNQWLQHRYHQPDDDMSQPMDLTGIEKELKVNFLTAYHIVNTLDTVKWNEGSFLYRRFSK